MKASNIGTVNAVSPCCGLYTIPFLIRPLRRGATVVTSTPSTEAMSPERCGPGPSSAIARMATGLSAACALRHAFTLAKMVAGVDRVGDLDGFGIGQKRIGDAAPTWLRMLPCILAQSILNFYIPPCSIRSHPLRRSSLCGGADPLVLLYEPSRLMRVANWGISCTGFS